MYPFTSVRTSALAPGATHEVAAWIPSRRSALRFVLTVPLERGILPEAFH